MNQNIYRVVYNTIRSAWVVTSEHTKAHGKTKSQQSGNAHRSFVLKTVGLAMMGAFSSYAYADGTFVADPAQTGNKPIVGVAGNGTAIINIVPPNAAGVSKNLFTDYQVPEKGVILNNSGAGSTTQLGGAIGGNPMLGNAAASTIINQVTGGKLTTIAGSHEVAGKSANLVIANPWGITVNGSQPVRFINSPEVSLITGYPILNAQGALDRYDIHGGWLNVKGQGIDAKGNNRLNLMTRAANIAGDIRADGKQLNVIVGANQIKADFSNINPMIKETHPVYALDVSALGGMYAGQMNIVATEQGLGVNNKGYIALSESSAGANASLSIDVNGNLTNTKGIISAGGGNSKVQERFQVAKPGTGSLSISTSGDLSNQGGLFMGRNISLSADGNIDMTTLTKTTKTGDMANSTKTGTATHNVSLDGLATVNAWGADRTSTYTLSSGEKLSYSTPALNIDAGKKLSLTAAAITSRGSAQLYGAEGIDLNTVGTLTSSRSIVRTKVKTADEALYDKYKETQSDIRSLKEVEMGTAIKATKDLSLISSGDINARAATLVADQNLGLSGNMINLDSGRAITDSYKSVFHKYTKDPVVGSTVTTATDQTLTVTHGDTSLGTQLIGNNVNVFASKGITTKGSTLFAQNRVDLSTVTGNINLAASADNYHDSDKYKQTKLDFDWSWTNFIKFGQTKTSQAIVGDKFGYTGTTVSSLGDVSISAKQGGMTVSKGTIDALSGDVDITARNIRIQDLNETAKKTFINKYKFTGLQIQVQSPILSAANMGKTIYDQSKDASGTTQVAALTVSGALAAYNAYRNLTDLYNAVGNAKSFGEAAGQLGSVSLSLGVQKQFNETVSQTSTSNGSQVTAGGAVNLTATGLGKSTTLDTIASNTGSDIFVQGSTVAGVQQTILKADDDIQLIAGRSGAKVLTTESTADASIGASASITGFSLNVAASGGKAHKSTEELMNNEAIIGDKNSQTQLISGNDTNIIGSQVFGKKVYADVGRSLSIRSLQDSYTFDSTKKNYGVSLQAPLGGTGFGVNVNAGKTTMMSRYTSVIEQAGIYAGKDGFDINVKGATNIKSAKITSTSGDWAKNILHTQTLNLEANLNNSAAYRANAVSASIGFNTDTSQGFYGITPSAPIAMTAKGDADSTTHSTINGTISNAAGAAPVINGTGTLDRADDGLDTAALKQIFDEKKVNTGFAIATTLGQNLSEFRTIKARDIDNAGKALAVDAAGNPVLGKDGKPLTVAQAAKLDPNDVGYGQATGEAFDKYIGLQKAWGNGGFGTILLTAVAGAANGNVTGSGAEFLQNAAINVARQYTATEIKRVADSFFTVDPVTGERKSNVLSELVRGALHAMASCGGAAATGASCKTAAGAAVATVALNNLLIGVNTKDMTEAQKLAYSNLIQTIITGAATGMNMDSAAGQLASKMEIENNAFGMKEGDWKDISYTVFKEGVSLVGIVYKPARFGTLICPRFHGQFKRLI